MKPVAPDSCSVASEAYSTSFEVDLGCNILVQTVHSSAVKGAQITAYVEAGKLSTQVRYAF